MYDNLGGFKMIFFEQIGKRLTDAEQNVVQQTQNLADVTRLNSEISEKQKKISQLFLLIGQSYYEEHKSDADAEQIDKIAQINELYGDIFTNREKIKQVKGIMKCENCGVDVPLNASFCNACGTKMNRVEIINSNDETECVCPICHMVIESDNVFCNHCGTKIKM